jgi:hypothetical protein
MAAAYEQYCKEMFQKFGYLATWTPGVQLQLGDIGIVDKWQFTRLTNLADLDPAIGFQVRDDTSKEVQKHASSGSTSVTFKAAGKAPQVGSVLSQAEAGFTVEFKRSFSTVYEAVGCVTPSIKDQATLGQEILNRYRKGKWNKEWVVITELVTADSATVLISQNSNSKIELSASGAVAAGSISLADASAGLQVAFARDMATSIICQSGLTPLFKARGVKSGGAIGPLSKAIRLTEGGVRALHMMTEKEAMASDDLFFGYSGYDLSVEDNELQAGAD